MPGGTTTLSALAGAIAAKAPISATTARSEPRSPEGYQFVNMTLLP
jgi:hypothetical protein